MDRYIVHLPAVRDGDLMLCHQHGIAYQRDMTITRAYDAAYFDIYRGYQGSEIARKLNEGRVAFVKERVGHDTPVLDIGIGCGDFIKARGGETYGYDVNPVAEEWLKDRGLWSHDFHLFNAFTFWDVLEHIPDPDFYFSRMSAGSHLFTSIPIFRDLTKIRESKHYRPGEHLYYYTVHGLVAWMECHGFRLLAVNDRESKAGRDCIYSFAFKRDA